MRKKLNIEQAESIKPILSDEAKSNLQITLKGIPSSPGISIGNALIIEPAKLIIPQQKIPHEKIGEEILKFEKASDSISDELLSLLKKLKNESNNIYAIVETNLMIITDPILKDTIKASIEKGYSVECSVISEFDNQIKFLRRSRDTILRERVNDLENIKQRLLEMLRNQNRHYNVEHDTIIIAQNISTTDIVKYSEFNISGLITEVGGIASHASILTRSYEIPSVIGVKDALSKIKNNSKMILDGYAGLIIVNPTPETIEKYNKKRHKIEKHKEELGELAKLPSKTIDNKTIKVLANINSLRDLNSSYIVGVDGIGLARSENLFFGEPEIPHENRQYGVYKKISESLYPKPVVIRAFDFGSDKYLPGMPGKESNPALGFRGIRYLLSREDVFISQIRAILRASINKNLSIMLPMISNLSELYKSIQLIDYCKMQLDVEGVEYDNNIPIGIMVETPSAALIIDKLIDYVDFISIGTNDLTQYTIAVDRTNELVSETFDSFHPAVLKLVHYVCSVANERNVPVSVCGEIAGHFAATELLIGLGAGSLSVGLTLTYELKSKIRHTSFSSAKKLADKAINLSTQYEVRQLVETDLNGNSTNFYYKNNSN